MVLTGRDEAIETVRARTDIVELVGRYLKLKKVGSRYVGLCPFHAEKTPSFSVNPQKGFFHCFGCKASGDVFTFLMRMEGKTFPEALQELAARAGVQLPALRMPSPRQREQKQAVLNILQGAARFYEERLWSPEGKEALAYLNQRQLQEEIVRRYQLGYAPGGWQALTDKLGQLGASVEDAMKAGLVLKGRRGPYDVFRNRLIFPIKALDDAVHGFGARKLDPGDQGGKYINSGQGLVFDKSGILYGLLQARQSIQQKNRAVLVEGYFDVLSMVSAGIQEAVATCGTALTVGHARLLRRFCDKVITMFDADTAGYKASYKSAEILLEQDISPYMVSLPEGEDPDTFVRKFGTEAMEQLVEKARPSIEVLSDKLIESAGSDVEARTRAVKRLMPMVQACTDQVRKGAYIRLLSEKFQLSEVHIRSAAALSKGSSPEALQERQAEKQLKISASKVELQLVSLLLNHPELAKKVYERNADMDIRTEYVLTLVKSIARDPGASVSRLLEDVPDDGDRQWLWAKMARSDEMEQSFDTNEETLDLIIRKLRLASLQEQRTALLARIEKSSRMDKSEEIRALRSAKLSLDREIQALGLPVKILH